MRRILRLPVGIPILRYNVQISKWQYFVTTVEAMYPEDEVTDVGHPPWVFVERRLESLLEWLDIKSDGVMQIPIPSKKYPRILVAVTHIEFLSDLSNIDWKKFVENFSTDENEWKEKYLNEIPYQPLKIFKSFEPDLFTKDLFTKEFKVKKSDLLDTISYSHSLIKEKNARFISSAIA